MSDKAKEITVRRIIYREIIDYIEHCIDSLISLKHKFVENEFILRFREVSEDGTLKNHNDRQDEVEAEVENTKDSEDNCTTHQENKEIYKHTKLNNKQFIQDAVNAFKLNENNNNRNERKKDERNYVVDNKISHQENYEETKNIVNYLNNNQEELENLVNFNNSNNISRKRKVNGDNVNESCIERDGYKTMMQRRCVQFREKPSTTKQIEPRSRIPVAGLPVNHHNSTVMARSKRTWYTNPLHVIPTARITPPTVTPTTRIAPPTAKTTARTIRHRVTPTARTIPPPTTPTARAGVTPSKPSARATTATDAGYSNVGAQTPAIRCAISRNRPRCSISEDSAGHMCIRTSWTTSAENALLREQIDGVEPFGEACPSPAMSWIYAGRPYIDPNGRLVGARSPVTFEIAARAPDARFTTPLRSIVAAPAVTPDSFTIRSREPRSAPSERRSPAHAPRLLDPTEVKSFRDRLRLVNICEIMRSNRKDDGGAFRSHFVTDRAAREFNNARNRLNCPTAELAARAIRAGRRNKTRLTRTQRRRMARR